LTICLSGTRSITQKLQKMKTQRDVVLRETTVMQSAFTHIDSQLLDRSPKLKLLHKVRRLCVWRFVCFPQYLLVASKA
jgi:hypothetical protein